MREPAERAQVPSSLCCSRQPRCDGRREDVTEALTENGITVLDNSYVPHRTRRRPLLACGTRRPVVRQARSRRGDPASICNMPHEPIMLLCHAPDYVDELLTLPVGQAPSLMLCGHTHGGQVRLPFVGPLVLPPMGRKYVEGWFRFGNLQLYVNRGHRHSRLARPVRLPAGDYPPHATTPRELAIAPPTFGQYHFSCDRSCPRDRHSIDAQGGRSHRSAKHQVVADRRHVAQHLGQVSRNRYLFHRVRQLAVLDPQARSRRASSRP